MKKKKKISRNISRKYSQKLLNHNNLLQIHLKLLQKEQFKTAEATGDLSGNKISDKIKKFTTAHFRDS